MYLHQMAPPVMSFTVLTRVLIKVLYITNKYQLCILPPLFYYFERQQKSISYEKRNEKAFFLGMTAFSYTTKTHGSVKGNN